MQDINHQSRNARGSSPPFQESKGGIDDRASGPHWLKEQTDGSRQVRECTAESADKEAVSLLPKEETTVRKNDAAESSEPRNIVR
jgi:hypothetical protein